MPESGVVILDAVVQYADNCVLSYMYNSEGNSSGWIREAMAKDGNNYTGARAWGRVQILATPPNLDS